MPATLGEMKSLNCFCHRKPLLAKYGVDSDGKLYVHIRVYKQNRIFSESIMRGGEIEIKCRECFRWHKIRIVDSRPIVSEEKEPSGSVLVAESDVEMSDDKV